MKLITKSVFVPLRSAELLCIHASAFAYVDVPLFPAVFCEVLAEVHPAGFCVPLHFTVFVCAPAPVHVLSYL